MGSLREDQELEGGARKKKVMWVSPKVIIGADYSYNPPERWGHSSCFFNGLLYIFGGCRGGVHFSDVLVCDLETMNWNILKTSGQGPGPRDSHSAVLVGHRMFVFGGTNGYKKVNNLHVLDLLSREWTRPECGGIPPSPRESHTANVFGDEKLVIFGGSGEGEGNYLNDLHILDLNKMEWSSPETTGNVPAPRDSHSSVAMGNRLFVFGGDSGDRYQRDVNVFDMNTVAWAKLDGHGPSPGARAGHASVSIGTKVYVIGGVGDKKYYSDIWVLDVITSSWNQLDVCSQKSQGRFSHTATVTSLGIAIFGGCGEDERPLNELVILQMDSVSCKVSETRSPFLSVEGTKMFFKKSEDNLKQTIVIDDNPPSLSASKDIEELQFVSKEFFFSSDMLHPKRRRTCNSTVAEPNADSDDHSLSRTQNSMKRNNTSSHPSVRVHPLFRQRIPSPGNDQLSNVPMNPTNLEQRKQEQTRIISAVDPCQEPGTFRNIIGAEVHGQVDGAFDSGYLMTATVNGKVYRGVLFAPGPDFIPRSGIPSSGQHIAVNYQNNTGNNNFNNIGSRRHCLQTFRPLDPGPVQLKRSSPEIRADPLSLDKESRRLKTELQGVVLTLAGPGNDHGISRV